MHSAPISLFEFTELDLLHRYRNLEQTPRWTLWLSGCPKPTVRASSGVKGVLERLITLVTERSAPIAALGLQTTSTSGVSPIPEKPRHPWVVRGDYEVHLEGFGHNLTYLHEGPACRR